MIEFLFGWLIKPQYELTFLDSITAVVLIIALCFLSIYLYAAIQTLIETIKEKINERKN